MFAKIILLFSSLDDFIKEMKFFTQEPLAKVADPNFRPPPSLRGSDFCRERCRSGSFA